MLWVPLLLDKRTIGPVWITQWSTWLSTKSPALSRTESKRGMNSLGTLKACWVRLTSCFDYLPVVHVGLLDSFWSCATHQLCSSDENLPAVPSLLHNFVTFCSRSCIVEWNSGGEPSQPIAIVLWAGPKNVPLSEGTFVMILSIFEHCNHGLAVLFFEPMNFIWCVFSSVCCSVALGS